ncbi:CHRD domain-containing protein [Pseudoduganella danionis]|nr:CHRD domain-containing protein [Pseudoduganella danionis]
MKPILHYRWTQLAAAAGLLLGLAAAMPAAQAAASNYTAILTGAQEAPPNASTAIGATVVRFDASTHMLEIDAAFGGLLGDSTAAHIHCCTSMAGSGTAPVMTELPTLLGFPLGERSGAYSHVFDTSLSSTWNPAFIASHGGTTAGAESAFAMGLDSGTAYFNIHSTLYPQGEIRGFLQQAPAVPEPASIAMLGLGLPAVLLVARRRRRA